MNMNTLYIMLGFIFVYAMISNAREKIKKRDEKSKEAFERLQTPAYKKELEKVIKFMSGKAVGDTLANQGLFPSVHPEVKNPVNGRPMLWVGWDFIYSNDMGELIKKCEETFKEGAAE